MTLRKKLVKLKNDNPYLKLLWFKRLARRASKSESVPDRKWIEIAFERTFGRKPNLDDPISYYEKLNWLKLYYRNDLMPIVADKYAVRQYLIEKGYGELLNDLLGVWEDANDFAQMNYLNGLCLRPHMQAGQPGILLSRTRVR